LALVSLLSLFWIAAGVQAQTASPSWKADWERVLAGAKEEGTLMIGGPPAIQYRDALIAFQKAFPNIKVEYFGGSGRDFAPRILAERRADKFLWDVHVGGAGTPNLQLKPEGVFDPLGSALILPEALDDGVWAGGFNDGWMDKEKRFIYAFSGEVNPQVYVNRDLIPEAELSRVEDLVSPKWRGKIAWNEPRAQGSGSATAGYWIYLLGEEFVKKLLQHEIVAVRDLRQQAQWLVQGKYPIGISVDEQYLNIFKEKGVGLNVKPLAHDSPAGGGTRIGPGFGSVMRINRSPHPNAAKLFINWLLSREGQVIYVKSTAVNSRRLDVREGPLESAPKRGVKYININKEEFNPYQVKAIKIAKEILQ
jgi:iron(III) transport system substrate-binding protein